jgi:type II secretory pathway predicted ATPase ExeA/tetratricopeptide (TPR) repeat protein
MYIAHFGLKDFPFGDISSPAELFENDQLKEVVAHFFYALENHEPFFLLTGEVGTGKSTAVKAILAQLPLGTPRALVSHTSLSPRQLLIEIAVKFGLPEEEPVSKRRLLSQLQELLAGHARGGKRAVLIVDEAHLLADSCLEEIRLLSNLHMDGLPLLQTCLVGQPELNERLRQDHLRQLRQRISVRYVLKVMSKVETREYLEKRLRVAGCARPKELFSPEASDTIYEWTRGYPREVNVLARQALLNAYLEDALVVTREHVLGVQEFGFEGLGVHLALPSPATSVSTPPPGLPTPPPEGKLGEVDPVTRIDEHGSISFSHPEPVIEAPGLIRFDSLENEARSARTWPLFDIFLLLGGIGAAVYLYSLQPFSVDGPLPSPPAADRMADAPDAADDILPASEPDVLPAPEIEASVGEAPAEALPTPAGSESTASEPPAPAPPAAPLSASVSDVTTSPPNPSLPRTEPVRIGNVRSSEAATVYRAAESPTRDPRSLAADRVEEGVALARGQALDAAVDAFGQAIEIDPSYAEAHYNLGLARLRQGDLEGAVQAFRKVVSIRPDSEDAYRHLGVALWKQGELGEAVTAFRKAIALNPDDALAHHNLALALRDQGALDEAIEELRQVIALDPRDAIAQHNLGIALRDKGRTGDAIEAYRRAIELNPRDALAYRNLGAAFLSESRFDEAIYVLQQALFLTPDDPQIHNSLGFALRSTNRPEAAMAAFSKAIELDPDYALAHYNLALSLGHLGRQEEARREFELAQQLGYKSLAPSRAPTQPTNEDR